MKAPLHSAPVNLLMISGSSVPVGSHMTKAAVTSDICRTSQSNRLHQPQQTMVLCLRPERHSCVSLSLEEPANVSVLIDVYIQSSGFAAESRHRSHFTEKRIDESGAR